MQIIPVLDIRGGLVVRARGGDRSNYTPIATLLAPGTSRPEAIVAGLLGLWPGFSHLYIADLDGIEGHPRQRSLILALAQHFPELAIRLDDGSRTPEDVADLVAAGIRPVIGSETLASADDLTALAARLPPDSYTLSLDWRGEEPLGPPQVFADSATWPAEIVVMTLARVGAGRGPDIERVAAAVAAAGPRRRLLAAGGVRGPEDVAALATAGAAGVLVATALHDGGLTGHDVATLTAVPRS
ncbi:MAG: HisA/HisF-related TIM barrel protein [Hyphomicrobiaceae bacterium]|nr:HisA/HisF-related TIM barrel protein [Hyphomicrobiaceae bacterium]